MLGETVTKQSISQRAIAGMRPIPPGPQIITSHPIGRGWYVAYCNVKCEVRAQMGLSAKGFGTFLPMEASVKVRRGRRIKTTRPVFGRYLFVSFDPEAEEWFDPIKSTDGIESILENNGSPVRVARGMIEDLQRFAANGGFDRDDLPAPGTVMRVADGPYKDFIGKVQKANPNSRVKLLMKMFNGDVTVDFPLGVLEQIR